jgi:hypothetical protein
MKQTAVEFLIKEFSDILGPLDTKPMQDLLMMDSMKRAKEMEKEISRKMYEHATWAILDHGHGETFDEYWNRTFKN